MASDGKSIKLNGIASGYDGKNPAVQCNEAPGVKEGGKANRRVNYRQSKSVKVAVWFYSPGSAPADVSAACQLAWLTKVEIQSFEASGSAENPSVDKPGTRNP